LYLYIIEGKPKKKAQKNDSDASLSSNDAQGKTTTELGHVKVVIIIST